MHAGRGQRRDCAHKGHAGAERLWSGSRRETQPSVALEGSLGLHLFCRKVLCPEKGRSHRTSEGLKGDKGNWRATLPERGAGCWPHKLGGS